MLFAMWGNSIHIFAGHLTYKYRNTPQLITGEHAVCVKQWFKLTAEISITSFSFRGILPIYLRSFLMFFQHYVYYVVYL